MNMTQTPVERRQLPRYKAVDGVFAALVNHNSKLGQIKDISELGLSFRYIDTGDPSDEPTELKIIVGERGVYLDNLPFKKVNDFEIKNEHSFSTLKMRQIGLQFGELNPQQRIRVVRLLQHHTVREE